MYLYVCLYVILGMCVCIYQSVCIYLYVCTNMSLCYIGRNVSVCLMSAEKTLSQQGPLFEIKTGKSRVHFLFKAAASAICWYWHYKGGAVVNQSYAFVRYHMFSVKERGRRAHFWFEQSVSSASDPV